MPTPGAWDEEDEWYASDRWGARHVRPPRRFEPELPRRGREDYLAPGAPAPQHVSYGLHRSRSQGHAPTPNIHIYNDIAADSHPNVSNKQDGSPGRRSSRGRAVGRDELGIEDELARIRIELQRNRSRSRGLAHFDHYHDHYGHPPAPAPPPRSTSPGRDKYIELEIAKRELAQKKAELERDQYEESVKREFELRRAKERVEREEEEREREKLAASMKKDYEYKRSKEMREREEREREEEAERKRIIAEANMKQERKEREEKETRQRAVDEWSRKREEEARKAKEAEQRAVDEFNRKKAVTEAKVKDEQKRAVEEYQRKEQERKDEQKAKTEKIIAEYESKKVNDAKKQKEMEDALIAKLAKQEEERKAKETAEYEAFLAKKAAKDAEEKAKKEAAEKEFEERMSRRLHESGFQYNQIQAMIKPEKQKDLSPGFLPNNPVHLSHQPTYIKVHRDHLSIDTLTYFNIPWRYDDADRSYFIILREMDQHETDMLFEHTQRLRTRTTTKLLIEERGGRDKPEYAFVRHKSKRAVSPSPNRRRKSSPKMIGLRLF